MCKEAGKTTHDENNQSIEIGVYEHVKKRHKRYSKKKKKKTGWTSKDEKCNILNKNK